MRALKFREFDNVGLAPFEKLLPNLRGGFASPDQLPATFRHRRRGKPRKDQAVHADMTGAPLLEPGPGETFVYGGVLHWHFGHLVAEFLHRLWVLRQPGLENATVLFVGSKEVPQVFRDCMRYFGVRHWRMVDQPCVVSKLVIAEQGKSIGEAPHPDYQAFLAALVKENGLDDMKGPARVAMMRGHLTERRFLGEATVERFLEAEGYRLFRPEEHDLRTQLATLWHARELVLSDGSGCHLFDLLPRTQARVALISRARPSEWKPRDALAVINSVASKCAETRVFSDTCQLAVPLEDGRQKPQGLRYVPLDKLVDFLAAHGFVREGACLKERPQLFADLQVYAEQHLGDQLPTGANADDLVGYLAARLHAQVSENERLTAQLMQKPGFGGFLRRIRGR